MLPLRRQASASALLHLRGEVAHGWLCDDPPITTSKRGFGLIDSGKNFRPLALAFFPERKGFPHRIFFAVKLPACNGLTDKRLLVGGELYFHCLQSAVIHAGRQVCFP